MLQRTFGCSWNRCTFCTFYQGRAFEVRSVEEFGRHLEAVRTLLGRAADARRSVFLADGNALVLANARLRPLLTEARQAFPDRPVAGFVEVFGGRRKALEDWQELRALGLRRVAVGLETGHDALLARLPLDANDIVYLSPFVLYGESAYAARAAMDGLEELSEPERAAQHHALQAAARRGVPKVRVAPYRIDEFVY